MEILIKASKEVLNSKTDLSLTHQYYFSGNLSVQSTTNLTTVFVPNLTLCKYVL